jgi:hypothetical protein
MAKQQRLTGVCTYADGLPFNGVLRVHRNDGNALEVVMRDIQIVNGVIPDYVKLNPGIYEIQWLATTPSGFLPTENWVVPEADELHLKDMRGAHSLESIIVRKDAIIAVLRGEVERLRNALKTKPVTPLTPEDVIQTQIRAITGEQ